MDGIGIGGIVTQYATALFFSLGALIFFLYSYIKGLCPFDESAKMEMLDE